MRHFKIIALKFYIKEAIFCANLKYRRTKRKHRQ